MIVNVSIGEPEKARGTVVLVDVIRSSTTISVALDKGVKFVVPFKSSDQAREAGEKWSKKEDVLLVGEEFGQKPKGFDMSISPRKMTEDRVEDKVIIYRSTNLTRVLEATKGAETIIVGGLVNSESVGNFISKLGPETVNITACGVRKKESRLLKEEYDAPCDPCGEANIEDIIGAGSIVHQLHSETITDLATVSLLAYRNSDWRKKIKEGCVPQVADKLGLEEDVSFCLVEDRNNIVPILSDGIIYPLSRLENL